MINLPLCNRWRNRRHLFRLEERQLASQPAVCPVQLRMCGNFNYWYPLGILYLQASQVLFALEGLFCFNIPSSLLSIFLFFSLNQTRLNWSGLVVSQLCQCVFLPTNILKVSQLGTFPKAYLSQLASQVGISPNQNTKNILD